MFHACVFFSFFGLSFLKRNEEKPKFMKFCVFKQGGTVVRFSCVLFILPFFQSKILTILCDIRVRIALFFPFDVGRIKSHKISPKISPQSDLYENKNEQKKNKYETLQIICIFHQTAEERDFDFETKIEATEIPLNQLFHNIFAIVNVLTIVNDMT